MNGDPGLPDEELPTPDEQIAEIGERLAPESEDLPAQEHGLDQLHEENTQTVRMRKLYDQGLDDKAIAAQLGLPHSNTVMWWRRKANLSPNKTKLPTKRTHKASPDTESVAAMALPEITAREMEAKMRTEIYEAQKTIEKMQESVPDSQVMSLAGITLKILLLVWKRVGKEEPT